MDNNKLARPTRQQRRNLLVVQAMEAPFGAAMALMLALLEYVFYDSSSRFDLVRGAMVLFAVGEIIFVAVTTERMAEWWGHVMSCAERRGRKTASTDAFMMAAMAMMVPLTWATLTGAETGEWGILQAVLGAIGVAMLATSWLITALFCKVFESDQKTEQARQIFVETNDCLTVLRRVLCVTKAD